MRVALDTAYASKPPPYTQINRAHPLAQGLSGVWLLGDSAKPFESLTGVQLTPNGAFSPSASPFGTAQIFDGSTVWQDISYSSSQQGLPYSAFAIVKTLNNSAFHPVLGIGTIVVGGSHTNYAGIVALFIDSLGRLYTWFGNNTATSDSGRYGAFTAAGAVPVGNWTALGSTVQGVGAISLYINGITQGATTFGSATTVSMPSWDGAIGHSNSAAEGTHYFAGSIALAFLWRRVLSPSEHMQLAAQPFCMFNRRPMPVAA